MENEYGGIRVYNFDVERFKAGQRSVVFPTAPAGFTYPSQNPDGSGPADFEGHSAIAAKWNKFAPRVGAAWDPTGRGRTSLRASYGIAYDVIELQSLLNSNNVSPWAADIIHRTGTLDNPWAGAARRQSVPVRLANECRSSHQGSVFIPFGDDLDMTYVQSWNLALQQQIVGPLAGVGELSWQQEQPAVEHDGGEPLVDHHAAVASQPLHRAGHLRARRRHVHALQLDRQHQPAARAAALGGA